jgi:hypothetical protein
MFSQRFYSVYYKEDNGYYNATQQIRALLLPKTQLYALLYCHKSTEDIQTSYKLRK